MMVATSVSHMSVMVAPFAWRCSRSFVRRLTEGGPTKKNDWWVDEAERPVRRRSRTAGWRSGEERRRDEERDERHERMRGWEREKVTACEVERGKVREITLTDRVYIFFE